ncbi:nucleoside phosphatase family-domain-containing protein [Lipomyces japonicus]|uniref:nucleoside phosphatase family-domain-containing protein n=1 Tax=Lipomyces japonicus TaxID=56871 RepID=UPI0034CE7E93
MPLVPELVNYGVVIDAGSSGSRVQVYSWPTTFTDNSILPEVGKGGTDWHKKESPGLSSFATHVNDIGHDHLSPLLDHAKKIVPASKHAETPIFLLATAGMRLVEPARLRDDMLERACSYIKQNSKFLVPDCAEHVRVIDGETEGLYGWLALNYMMGSLDRPDKHEHGKSHHTYGFLDMGGASAQVAFAPNSTEAEKHMNDLFKVRLRTQGGEPSEFNVFVSTWLGYGANQARQRYILSLQDDETKPERSHKQNKTERDEHNGWYGVNDDDNDDDDDDDDDDEDDDDDHKNDHHNDKKHDNAVVEDPCSPKGYTDDTVLPAKVLHGTGNFTQCVNKLLPLLSKDAPCSDDPCLFGGVHAPAIDFDVNHFIGVSEYWYTIQSGLFADALPTAQGISNDNGKNDNDDDGSTGGGAYDFATFSTRLKNYCAKDWAEIQAMETNVFDKEKLHLMCFKGAWIINVLHSGFGIPRTSALSSSDDTLTTTTKTGTEKLIEAAESKGFVDNFKSMDTINGVELSWTLGKMIVYASSQVPVRQGLGLANDELSVGYGANDGKFMVETGNTVIHSLPLSSSLISDDEYFNITTITSQGALSERRIPGLILFGAIIMIVIGLFAFGNKIKRQRKITTYSLAPKRYQRRRVIVNHDTTSASLQDDLEAAASIASDEK